MYHLQVILIKACIVSFCKMNISENKCFNIIWINTGVYKYKMKVMKVANLETGAVLVP